MSCNHCDCGAPLKQTYSGTVCSRCLGYQDRCLCAPKDLRRVLVMLGVIESDKEDERP